MSPTRILVIGSLNVDMVTRTPKLPGAGETLTATSFSTGCGGKGANQAVACARAASRRYHGQDRSSPIMEVYMVGAVGSDSYGGMLISELSDNHINTECVKRFEDQITGVANIIVEEKSGENRIMVVPGANGSVTEADFNIYAYFVQPLPDLVVLQLEIPLETVLAVMNLAKECGVEVLLNPAPPLKIPDESLRGLGHLIMNFPEAIALAGNAAQPGVDGDFKRRIFKKFEALGVQNTIITLGNQGVLYSTGGGEYEQVQAVRVKQVVDTTAAGDTFVGYYAVEVARWKKERPGEAFSIGRAVYKANLAAARTVEKAGAMQSIPWADEI
jgi:ribokinase